MSETKMSEEEAFKHYKTRTEEAERRIAALLERFGAVEGALAGAASLVGGGAIEAGVRANLLLKLQTLRNVISEESEAHNKTKAENVRLTTELEKKTYQVEHLKKELRAELAKNAAA